MLSLRVESQRCKMAVTLCLLLLSVNSLLSEDELDVKAIVDLVLFGVLNSDEGILEVHNRTLEAH